MSQQSCTYAIEQLNGVDSKDLEAINRLLPVLSSSAKPLSLEQLERVVASKSNKLFVVRGSDGTILACATLVVVEQIVGTKCWVEDVVVDESLQGQGIGKNLIQRLIESAPSATKHINLTSKPYRGAAHKLYGGLGFLERETLVFRYTPES